MARGLLHSAGLRCRPQPASRSSADYRLSTTPARRWLLAFHASMLVALVQPIATLIIYNSE